MPNPFCEVGVGVSFGVVPSVWIRHNAEAFQRPFRKARRSSSGR
jgi:hypothetical protein